MQKILLDNYSWARSIPTISFFSPFFFFLINYFFHKNWGCQPLKKCQIKYIGLHWKDMQEIGFSLPSSPIQSRHVAKLQINALPLYTQWIIKSKYFFIQKKKLKVGLPSTSIILLLLIIISTKIFNLDLSLFKRKGWRKKDFQLGPFFIQKKKMKEKRELCHCFGVRVGDKTLTSLLDDLGF